MSPDSDIFLIISAELAESVFCSNLLRYHLMVSTLSEMEDAISAEVLPSAICFTMSISRGVSAVVVFVTGCVGYCFCKVTLFVIEKHHP